MHPCWVIIDCLQVWGIPCPETSSADILQQVVCLCNFADRFLLDIHFLTSEKAVELYAVCAVKLPVEISQDTFQPCIWPADV